VKAKRRVTVWLEQDLAEWIDQKAEEEDRNRSNMVAVLLKKCRKTENVKAN
jgi:metal-responsive CopG/Arc/MetJ family transcriptional regulator